MALTITKQPEQVVPAKNQCDIEVTTNAYVLNAGVKAEWETDLDNNPVDGDNFSILVSGKQLDFEFKTTPDDSGFQIPLNPTALSGTDYFNTVFAPALQNCYYLRNHRVLLIAPGSTTVTFVIRAIEVGSQYNITTIDLSGCSVMTGSVTIISGVDKTYRPNFRVLLDIYGQDKTDPTKDVIVFSAEGIPNSSNITPFDLQKVLEALSSYSIPPFEESDLIFPSKGSLLFYCKFAELYGDPPTPRKYKRWPLTEGVYATALHGASANSKYPFEFYNEHYFKTAMRSGSVIVHPNQKQYLTYYNVPPIIDIGYFLKTEVKLYYTDNTDSGWIIKAAEQIFDATPLTNCPQYLTVQCGYMQLGIDALKASGKTVYKYEVRVAAVENEDDPNTNDSFTFFVEQTTPRNPRFFLFINSYGFPETAYFYGKQDRSISLEKTEVQRYNLSVDAVYGIVHGEFDEANTEWRRSIELSTGNKDKAHLDWFNDFLSSPCRYEQAVGQWVKYILEKGNIVTDTDDSTVFALNLKMKQAYMERGIA